MTIEKIKELLDVCYQAKRVRELLPDVPFSTHRTETVRESHPHTFTILIP